MGQEPPDCVADVHPLQVTKQAVNFARGGLGARLSVCVMHIKNAGQKQQLRPANYYCMIE